MKCPRGAGDPRRLPLGTTGTSEGREEKQIGDAIMPSRFERNEYLDALAAEHRSWLSPFDAQYLRYFERLLHADYESAMTEAGIRRLLQSHNVSVEPNEDLTGSRRQPDFLCSHLQHSFCVEVTCISIDKAVKETRLPYPTEKGGRNYRSLNDGFWTACRRKASQCGRLVHPALVAIGTFHTDASILCLEKPHVAMLLTGETKMTCNIDIRKGEFVGDPYETTEFRSAAFLRRDESESAGFARNSVSGLLVCGLGIAPPRVLGVLHPNPARRFDPAILPGIEFGEVEIDRALGELRVSWPTPAVS